MRPVGRITIEATSLNALLPGPPAVLHAALAVAREIRETAAGRFGIKTMPGSPSDDKTNSGISSTGGPDSPARHPNDIADLQTQLRVVRQAAKSALERERQAARKLQALQMSRQ